MLVWEEGSGSPQTRNGGVERRTETGYPSAQSRYAWSTLQPSNRLCHKRPGSIEQPPSKTRRLQSPVRCVGSFQYEGIDVKASLMCCGDWSHVLMVRNGDMRQDSMIIKFLGGSEKRLRATGTGARGR